MSVKAFKYFIELLRINIGKHVPCRNGNRAAPFDKELETFHEVMRSALFCLSRRTSAL